MLSNWNSKPYCAPSSAVFSGPTSRPHAAGAAERAEELLEAGRSDDLEDPAGLVAGVPEGVPLVAGLEDQIAGAGLDDLVAEQRSHAALEHEAVLVLPRVAV